MGKLACSTCGNEIEPSAACPVDGTVAAPEAFEVKPKIPSGPDADSIAAEAPTGKAEGSYVAKKKGTK